MASHRAIKIIYGVYDMDNNEQCVCVGYAGEVAKFLGIKSASSVWVRSHRKSVVGRRWHQRYRVVELEGVSEDGAERETQR